MNLRVRFSEFINALITNLPTPTDPSYLDKTEPEIEVIIGSK